MTHETPMPRCVAGFRRRIELHPLRGVALAGLEDDFHRFTLELGHRDGVVTALKTTEERYPWSTCVDAGGLLSEQTLGLSLRELEQLNPREHCTHLFELMILCAARAHDREPLRIDLFVADHAPDQSTWATLSENGTVVLRWQVRGTLIEAPEPWTGKDLRRLSSWKQSLDPQTARHAMLLRRVVHLANGRRIPRHFPVQYAADRGEERMGACFTYQLPRARTAVQSTFLRKDFSQSGETLLKDYVPVKTITDESEAS